MDSCPRRLAGSIDSGAQVGLVAIALAPCDAPRPRPTSARFKWALCIHYDTGGFPATVTLKAGEKPIMYEDAI